VPDAAGFLLLPVIPLLLVFCHFRTARCAWGRRLTRFSNWGPWTAWFALAVIAGAVILGATLHPVPHRLRLAPLGISDATLYSAVVDRVMHGENYYTAAAAMHRTLAYPTAPAAVFREPTLAWALAAMRTDMIRRAVLFALSLVTFFALRRAMADAGISTRTRLLAIPLIGTGLAVAWAPTSFYLHETWAGLLIALSLASYRPGRWLLPVILGVTACLIRELAFPYLMAMAAFAAYERRNRELLAWCAGMLLFAAFFAWHLSAASGLHRLGDYVSDGWLYFGGWPFVLETAKRNFALYFASNGVVAFAVSLGLIGFAGARDPWISRVGLIVGGYMASFLIAGRPDNSYWGILYSPLLPIGVALSPLTVRDLIASALSPLRIPHRLRAMTRFRPQFAPRHIP
jgi:hypothetical protein